MWFSTRRVASATRILFRVPSFLSTRARNTKWGDAWTSVRDRESRNRGSEVSIIGYALAATRVLRPLAV